MATTINSYSVSLALNAKDYIKGSSLARSETNALKQAINAAKNPVEKYAQTYDLLEKALAKNAISLETYGRLLGEARAKADAFKAKVAETSVALGNSSEQVNRQSTALAGFGRSLAGPIAAFAGFHAIKGVIKDSITLAMETESAAMQFEVLTGSVKEADRMMRSLKSLAATTPLTFGDTQAAARTMLSFNVAANQILPSLKMIGDVTGGNSERFKMMTLAFSQMTSAGRMMGQDLLQMINAGFNPLQEISRKTGESMLELKTRMEEGGISSQEVAEAFKSATSEGGRFFGMIDKMATTTEGKFAKLRDTIDQIKRDLGAGLTPATNSALDKASELTRQFRTGAGIIAGGQDYSSIMGAEKDAMKKLKEQMDWANRQQALRMSGSPTMRSASSLAAQNSAADAAKEAEDKRSASAGIESAVTRGIESIKTGAGGIMSAIQAFQQGSAAIAMSGIANTEKIIAASKEDPAIASLEVGTQEAYRYLTQATRDAEKAARDDAAKKAQLEENAKKQRDKTNEWLDRINDALANNGFKRIR